MSNATLCVHAGGIRRSREELKGLYTPEPTKSWTPIPHHELVGAIHDRLREIGATVNREEYATMSRDAKLFGVLDLMVPGVSEADGIGMALGLNASNDKSMAIRLVAAARVFCCDNMSLSGSGNAVMMRAVHSARLRLEDKVPPAIDMFMDKAGVWRADLSEMKGLDLAPTTAKELIFDAFAASNPCLPVRLFGDVARLYFDDPEQRAKFPDPTLWSLNNAFTEAVKKLRPTGQFQYGQRIGRYFGRTLRRFKPVGPPAAVFDLGANDRVEGTGEILLGDDPEPAAPLGDDGAAELDDLPVTFEVPQPPVRDQEPVPEPEDWEEVWGSGD